MAKHNADSDGFVGTPETHSRASTSMSTNAPDSEKSDAKVRAGDTSAKQTESTPKWPSLRLKAKGNSEARQYIRVLEAEVTHLRERIESIDKKHEERYLQFERDVAKLTGERDELLARNDRLAEVMMEMEAECKRLRTTIREMELSASTSESEADASSSENASISSTKAASMLQSAERSLMRTHDSVENSVAGARSTHEVCEDDDPTAACAGANRGSVAKVVTTVVGSAIAIGGVGFCVQLFLMDGVSREQWWIGITNKLADLVRRQ